MNLQDLTHRLVVATEEQDVLYVLFWLQEMKQENCLEEAINSKHSFKGHSALGSIITSTFSQLRRIILELLLLSGAEAESEDDLEVAMEKNNVEVVEILLTWTTSGREAAKDAAHLLSLPIEFAATWIDLNLPPPPDVDSLTGYVALPPGSILDSDSTTSTAQVPEPELNHLETSNITSVVGKVSKACLVFETDKDHKTLSGMNDNGYVPVNHSKEINPATSSPPSPPLCSSSSKSVSPVESLPLLSSNSSHSTEGASKPSAFARHDCSRRSSSTATETIRSGPRKTSSLARLHLGHLPLDTRHSEVKVLFDDIGVASRIIRSHNKKDWGFCFVDVQSDEVTYCIRKLNRTRFGGCTMTCSLAVSTPFFPEPPSKRSCPPSPSSRPSHDHQFTPPRRPSPPQASQSHSLPPPLSTNLLVLNLPPHDTDQSTQFLLNLPTHTILDFTSKGQTVVFIKVDSEEVADRFTSLWNSCVVSGRIIKVVRAKRGLEAEEAALAYFEEREGPPADIGGSEPKKRRYW